jgi:hypothetical protein
MQSLLKILKVGTGQSCTALEMPSLTAQVLRWPTSVGMLVVFSLKIDAELLQGVVV